MATAGGVFWLTTSLPNKLSAIDKHMQQILNNQNRLETRVEALNREVREQDRRLIKVELR